MPIVNALAAVRVRAAILIPIDCEPTPQHTRGDERPDVQSGQEGLAVSWGCNDNAQRHDSAGRRHIMLSCALGGQRHGVCWHFSLPETLPGL